MFRKFNRQRRHQDNGISVTPHLFIPFYISLLPALSTFRSRPQSRGLYPSIASHAHQLRKLRLEVTVSDIFSISSVVPLYKCRLLEDVNLGSIDLDDRAIGAIAQAWPNLRECSLGARRSIRPACTLSSPRHFAEHCPNLSTIRTLVDAVEIIRNPQAISCILLRSCWNSMSGIHLAARRLIESQTISRTFFLP